MLESNTNIKETTIKQQYPCYDSNCQSCTNQKVCSECKPGFALLNNICYSNNCPIYGQCDYCTEFDCIQCKSHFEISYGFCEPTKDIITFEILIGVLLPLVIVITLTLIIMLIRKRRKKIGLEKVISAAILSQKRLASGQYIFINTTNITNTGVMSINTLNTQSSESNRIKIKPTEENKGGSHKCIFCNETTIVSLTVCGCGLCKVHNEESKGDLVYCPIHQTPIIESLVIKKGKKSLKKENLSDLSSGSQCKMCPVCQIFPATMTFNCGCSLLLCNKCFNDNIFVFKIGKCPGCHNVYKRM